MISIKAKIENHLRFGKLFTKQEQKFQNIAELEKHFNNTARKGDDLLNMLTKDANLIVIIDAKNESPVEKKADVQTQQEIKKAVDPIKVETKETKKKKGKK